MGSLRWRQFTAILRKDIVMELRTREMLTSMGLYAILTMVVYQIALAEAGEGLDVRLIMPGLVWVAFIFMSMLGLNRSFVHEKDQGCLEALLLSPVDRPVIFFAKFAGNLLFLLVVEALTLPVFAFLFLQGRAGFGGGLWMLALVLLGASIGIAGIGTLLATISVNTTGKDIMLAVLFVPLQYPLLRAAVGATFAGVIGGEGATSSFWTWMGWIAGFDIIMVLAAFGLYEFVIEA
ncbi:MAG: heme exporter protein CcmB [Anaerosomatales bacterium]|nr:heme exporter protein CcmB [Anaerosomatales bacterium]